MRAITLFYGLAILIIAGSSIKASAQSPTTYERDTLLTMVEVSRLIAEDREAHGATIRHLSTYLTTKQRAGLYTSHELSAGGPFVVNLLLGFGIGSYMQGNLGAGIASTLTESIGGYLFLENVDRYNGTTLTIIGAALFLTGKIIDIVAPWSYASSRNDQLRRNLDGFQLSVTTSQRYDLGAMPTLYPNVGIQVGL